MDPDKAQKMVEQLLSEPYWLPNLDTRTSYWRYEDDSPLGQLIISFSPDGDGHIHVMAEHDPNEGPKWSQRFRMPMMGGGQSPRVRNALLILAEAIRLDNIDSPQDRSS